MPDRTESEEEIRMNEKVYTTVCGDIHYWMNMESGIDRITLVFFPGHAKSWLFEFRFSLMDKTRWIDGMIHKEEILYPVIIA